MNIAEKVRIAEQLEKIECRHHRSRFPISSEGDFEAVKAISKTIKRSEVAALARANLKDIDRAWKRSRERGFLGSIRSFRPPTFISNTS